MEGSLYVSVAGQRHLERQLEVIAHNMANVNTAGYRAEMVDFKSLVSKTPEDNVYYPQIAKLYPALEQGPHIRTDSPLDVAIDGDAWFAINTPEGTALTRDGRFSISQFGELLSTEGYPVLDAGGAPIQLDPNGPAPEVTGDGRILSDGRQVGNIGVFVSPVENFKARYTNSAFLTEVEPIPVAAGNDVKLNQGFIEGSNVNAMNELAHLMTISRTFESVTSLIGKVDDTLARSVRELGGS